MVMTEAMIPLYNNHHKDQYSRELKALTYHIYRTKDTRRQIMGEKRKNRETNPNRKDPRSHMLAHEIHLTNNWL